MIPIETLIHLQPLFLVVLGSTISFLGVIYSIRKQWQLVEESRKREIKAENESNAISEARVRLQSIKELNLYDTEESCKNEIVSYNNWFFRAQPFLPPEFNNKWTGLRDSVVKLWQLQRGEKDGNNGKFQKLQDHIEKLIEESFEIIDSKLNVKKIEPEIVSLKNSIRRR